MNQRCRIHNRDYINFNLLFLDMPLISQNIGGTVSSIYGGIMYALHFYVECFLGCVFFPFRAVRDVTNFTLGIGYGVGCAIIYNDLRYDFTRDEYSRSLNSTYQFATVFLKFISFLCLYLDILFMISISRRLFRMNSVSYKKIAETGNTVIS